MEYSLNEWHEIYMGRVNKILFRNFDERLTWGITIDYERMAQDILDHKNDRERDDQNFNSCRINHETFYYRFELHSIGNYHRAGLTVDFGDMTKVRG